MAPDAVTPPDGFVLQGAMPPPPEGFEIQNNSTPRVPDLSNVHQMVKDNLAANDNKEIPEGGQPKPSLSQMQTLETGTGLPVQKIISGSAKDSDVDEANRGAYIKQIKDGTVSNGEGWLQSYFFGVGNAVQQGGERWLGQMAAPFMSTEQRQKLIDANILPPEGGTQLPANAALSARILHGLSEGLSPITAPVNAYWTLPASVVSPAINPTVEKVSDALPSAYASVPGDLLNILTTGAGAAGVHYADSIRESAATKLNMEPSAVTPEHVDQVIADGAKNLFPPKQDFESVATVMGLKVDDLHNVYEKTGKRPEQIFQDMQHDPSIKEDIGAGKIPDAYSGLVSPMRPDIEAAIKGAQEMKTPATSKEYAKDLYDRLHQKLGQDTATDIESMQRELQTKNTLGEDLDKEFYLKKEDESVALTEEKQKLYEQYVKPLGEQERALYEKARALGAEDVEPVSESYVHRIVKGKGHYLDKYDTEFGEDENIGFGKPTRSLSQSTAALEEAQFHALEDAEGNRQLKMEEIPKGLKAGDTWTDENGKEWTIKRAKTEEIEKATDLQYYKSAIGNTEDNIRKLEKTIRNIEFLNSLKDDMEKTKLGVPPSESYHPKDFQQVNIPQLRGWSFDSRVAEVLNDIYDRGGDSMLGRINNVLIKGMFLNPVPHVENVFYDYIASRGWKNAKAIKGADYINQGIKDVKTFSPEYLDVLKRGGALKLPAVWKQDFFNQMEKQFINEMQESKEGLDLAKSWGFDSVPHMVQSVFNQSQKALWGSGDAFLMAKIRELKDSGMSTDKAIEEAQKHIVDYRIPPRVGENILGPELSRMLAKSLQGNGIVVFTRYHYGLFKSLGNMVSELAGGIKEMDAAKTSQAAGQLFATYFLLSVVNPAIASMWGSITGQKEKMRNPGVTGLLGAISDFVTGKKSLGQSLKTQFILSPGIQIGGDLLQDKIADPKLGHVGVQLMDYLMKQPTMSIPAIPYNIREGKQSTGEEALRQIGVTPEKKYKEKKPFRKAMKRLEDEERGLRGD